MSYVQRGESVQTTTAFTTSVIGVIEAVRNQSSENLRDIPYWTEGVRLIVYLGQVSVWEICLPGSGYTGRCLCNPAFTYFLSGMNPMTNSRTALFSKAR